MIARAQDGTLLAARFLLAAALLPTGIARALNVSGFALTLAGSGLPFRTASPPRPWWSRSSAPSR